MLHYVQSSFIYYGQKLERIIYTIEYYPAIKNNEFIKFLGKWMELESIILKQGNPVTKECTCYALTNKRMLVQKLKINKLQFTQHRKLKKKEDLSEGAMVPLRKGT